MPSLSLYGGANCTRGCKCRGDTWIYNLANAKFDRVKVAPDNEPITRYRQSLVAYEQKLFVFGGESYKPYMYHNSVSELTLEEHADGTESSLAAGAPRW